MAIEILRVLAAFATTATILLPLANWYEKAKKELNENARDN